MEKRDGSETNPWPNYSIAHTHPDVPSGSILAEELDTGGDLYTYMPMLPNSGGCEAVPDGDRTYMNTDGSDTYYVLMSNTDTILTTTG